MTESRTVNLGIVVMLPMAFACGRTSYDASSDAAVIDAAVIDAAVIDAGEPDASDLLRCGPAGPAPVDLVAYYPLDGDPQLGSPDLSGNGLDGTCDTAATCPVIVTGVMGGAYSFDRAATQRVRVAPSVADDALLILTDGFTVAFWATAEMPDDTAVHNMIAKPLGTAGANSIQIGVTLGKIVFNADVDDSVRVSAQTDVRGEPGDWTHLAFSWAAESTGGDGLLRIYVDGGLAAASNQAVVVGWDGSDVLLGADIGGGQAVFGLLGNLDDVRIYRRPLTELEVEALANCGG